MAATNHKTLLDGVKASIDSMSLIYNTSETPEKLLIYHPVEIPNDIPGRPFVVVCPIGKEEIDKSGNYMVTNRSEIISYPVYVGIGITATPAKQFDSDELPFTWREEIIDKLVHISYSGLPTGSSHLDTILTPGFVIDPSAWKHNLIVSSINLACIVRKRRRVA